MVNFSDASTTLTTATPLNSTDPTLQLAEVIVRAADDRKAGDITVLGVEGVSTLADYFIIVTGFSKAQVRAIAGSIEASVETAFQRRPASIEGQMDGTWVLLDYSDVIVHIQMPEERDFYNLEAFWSHADRVDVATLLA